MSNPAQTEKIKFNPAEAIVALLDQIADAKFSKRVPLTMVLLSGVFAIYRTFHYLTVEFEVGPVVAFPTSVFIEGLVLAASALLFMALRQAFVAELEKEDEDLAAWGVHIALVLMVLAFFSLLGVAGADAWLVTKELIPAVLMTSIQATQALCIVSFIIAALIDERAKLREEHADYSRRVCSFPGCGMPITANNRARHEEKCPMNPKNKPVPAP